MTDAPKATPQPTTIEHRPIILVTGASRGLGRAVAERLGARGARIIAVARTTGALEELDDAIRAADGPTAVLTPLDLKDGDAIDGLGAALFERYGRLDGLIHAAAEGAPLTPVPHLEPKDVAKVVAVNLTATARLIRSMDPLLGLAPAGRALFVTDAAKAGGAFRGAYAASKSAAESLARSYAAEQSRVAVGLFEPAEMGTALRYKTHPGQVPDELASPADEAARLIAVFDRLNDGAPAEVAETTEASH